MIINYLGTHNKISANVPDNGLMFDIILIQEKWNVWILIVEAIEKLALIVFTRLRSIKNREESDLQSVVDEAIDFSVKNSIPAEVLLEGFNIYLSNNIFSAAYIYADAAAGMATGKIKSIAHCNAGVASYRMGLTDEAEKQYELVDGLV